MGVLLYKSSLQYDLGEDVGQGGVPHKAEGHTDLPQVAYFDLTLHQPHLTSQLCQALLLEAFFT